MYSYIKGTVEEINLDYIVIDNNNIGYKINVSSNTNFLCIIIILNKGIYMYCSHCCPCLTESLS